MSKELEGDRAMVMNLESFGVDGVGYDETDVALAPWRWTNDDLLR